MERRWGPSWPSLSLEEEQSQKNHTQAEKHPSSLRLPNGSVSYSLVSHRKAFSQEDKGTLYTLLRRRQSTLCLGSDRPYNQPT